MLLLHVIKIKIILFSVQLISSDELNAKENNLFSKSSVKRETHTHTKGEYGMEGGKYRKESETEIDRERKPWESRKRVAGREKRIEQKKQIEPSLAQLIWRQTPTPVFLTSLILKAELDKNGCAVQARLFVFLKVEIT